MIGKHIYFILFDEKAIVRQNVEGNYCLCTYMCIFMRKKHLVLDTLKCCIILSRILGKFGFLLCTSLCISRIFCHKNAFPWLAEKIPTLPNDLKYFKFKSKQITLEC